MKVLLSSSILATFSAHLILLDLTTLAILGERYKLWSSKLWSLLHSHPHWCLRILFSNILSLHSSLNVGDPVSQSYSININIIAHVKKKNSHLVQDSNLCLQLETRVRILVQTRIFRFILAFMTFRMIFWKSIYLI